MAAAAPVILSLSSDLPALGHSHVDGGLLATTMVLTTAACYWWHVSGPRSATEARQRTWGAAGWVISAAVLITPVHALAEQSVAWHMTQHLVLMLCAAPLFAAARVPATMLFRRRRAGRVHVPVIMRPVVRVLLRAPAGLAGFAQFVVLWVWHAPIAFSAATSNPWMHAAQHASFVGAAVWYWASILRGFSRGSRQATGLALLSLFMSALQSSVLGAFLALLQTPMYVVSRVDGHALTTLQDQQRAGLLMWVPGSVAYLVAAVLLARRLASEPRQREVRADELRRMGEQREDRPTRVSSSLPLGG